MDKEKFIEYGEHRRHEVDSAAKARQIYESSVYDEERIRRLRTLSNEELVEHTARLVEEHTERLVALLEAPANAALSKVDKETKNSRFTWLSRQINIPEIGDLSLEAFIDDLLSEEPRGHTLSLEPAIQKEGRAGTPTEDLIIARSMTTANVEDGPFVAGDKYTVITNSKINEDSTDPLRAAELEDRVGTLRVICDSAGVELPPNSN